MPNWVENTVEITGSREDIAALKEWASEDFSFNKMIPMPEELCGGTIGVTAGNLPVILNEKTKVFHHAYKGRWKKDANTAIDLMKTCNAAMAINNGYRPCKVCISNPNQKGQKYDRPLDEGAALVKKYGYDNWYDWARENWGVKWDCSELNAKWGKTFVNMFFFTAWSPPEPIYDVIVKKFPNLQVKWHYSESLNCYSGDFDTGEEFDYADPCEEENCDHDCEHCGETNGENNG